MNHNKSTRKPGDTVAGVSTQLIQAEQLHSE